MSKHIISEFIFHRNILTISKFKSKMLSVNEISVQLEFYKIMKI
jgi:hypothetical protein